MTVVIRLFGAYPEGMSFAIFIMNAFTPLINTYCKPKRDVYKRQALGGLNMNALKYLLPLWIAPVTGVTFRLLFGAAAFWLIDISVSYTHLKYLAEKIFS